MDSTIVHPQIVWLRDSSGLVYRAGANSNGQGYFVQPDGSDTRLLFNGAHRIAGLLQGETPSVLVQGGITGLDLLTVSINGGDLVPFGNGGGWLGGIDPTGRQVLYWSRAKLWLHPVDGEPRDLVMPQCDQGVSFCALSNDTIWAADGSKLIYSLSQSEGRHHYHTLWVLSLDASLRHEVVGGSKYGITKQYLPLSSTWVGWNRNSYPSPNSDASVLNSNDASMLPLSVLEGRSQRVVEWRYLP